MTVRVYIFTFILSLISFKVFSQSYQINASDSIACENLNVVFNLNTTVGVTTALWDFGNGLTSNSINPSAVAYDTGVYDVSVLINGSQLIEKQEYIQVYPTPQAFFTYTDSVLLGSFTIQFSVLPQNNSFDTVQYYYTWSFGDGVSYTGDSRNHGHRYPEEGEYFVNLNVADNYGCASGYNDTVTVSDMFNIPNVFTPDDDMFNDKLIIRTNGTTIYNIVIFTRTGTIVYKAESPVIVWDGYNSSGVKMPPGIYYYIIEEKNGSGKKQSGFFYMLYDK